MSLTRRHFVHVASLSLLAGAALPAAFAKQGTGAGSETYSLDNLGLLKGISSQTFAALIGQRFAVNSPGQSLGTLTLQSVDVTKPASTATKVHMVGRVPPSPQTPLTGFSLRFQGSGGSLPQGTYTFRNANLGSFSLFIVPSGPGVAPHTYTAVFNLLN